MQKPFKFFSTCPTTRNLIYSVEGADVDVAVFPSPESEDCGSADGGGVGCCISSAISKKKCGSPFTPNFKKSKTCHSQTHLVGSFWNGTYKISYSKEKPKSWSHYISLCAWAIANLLATNFTKIIWYISLLAIEIFHCPCAFFCWKLFHFAKPTYLHLSKLQNYHNNNPK